jgi:hypothetical protein
MADAYDSDGQRKSEDARVPTIGDFLRRSRLDALLQLLNILKGEMSFAGLVRCTRLISRSTAGRGVGRADCRELDELSVVFNLKLGALLCGSRLLFAEQVASLQVIW